MTFNSLIVDLISSLVIAFWFGWFSVVWYWYVVGISFSSIFSATVLKNVLNFAAIAYLFAVDFC